MAQFLKRMAQFGPSFSNSINPTVPLSLRTKATAANASRDGAEVGLLRAWIVFACGIGLYSLSQELVSPARGAFFNVDLRGDIDRQMSVAEEAAIREGRMGPEGDKEGKHTLWWRLAHVRDEARAGPTPSALWDNRMKA